MKKVVDKAFSSFFLTKFLQMIHKREHEPRVFEEIQDALKVWDEKKAKKKAKKVGSRVAGEADARKAGAESNTRVPVDTNTDTNTPADVNTPAVTRLADTTDTNRSAVDTNLPMDTTLAADTVTVPDSPPRIPSELKGKGKATVAKPMKKPLAAMTVSKPQRRVAKGLGVLHEHPCDECVKASQACEKEEAGGACVRCRRLKHKCSHSGPRGGTSEQRKKANRPRQPKAKVTTTMKGEKGEDEEDGQEEEAIEDRPTKRTKKAPHAKRSAYVPVDDPEPTQVLDPNDLGEYQQRTNHDDVQIPFAGVVEVEMNRFDEYIDGHIIQSKMKYEQHKELLEQTERRIKEVMDRMDAAMICLGARMTMDVDGNTDRLLVIERQIQELFNRLDKLCEFTGFTAATTATTGADTSAWADTNTTAADTRASADTRTAADTRMGADRSVEADTRAAATGPDTRAVADMAAVADTAVGADTAAVVDTGALADTAAGADTAASADTSAATDASGKGSADASVAADTRASADASAHEVSTIVVASAAEGQVQTDAHGATSTLLPPLGPLTRSRSRSRTPGPGTTSNLARGSDIGQKRKAGGSDDDRSTKKQHRTG